MDLLFLIFFPMLTALACPILDSRSPKGRDAVAVGTGLVELAVAMFTALGAKHAAALPLLEGLALEADGFRQVYIVVIAVMWAMTLLFSPRYFRGHHHLGRYYFFNLMTLGATMGVFLSADLFTSFVFFEVMSFTSFTWVIQEEAEAAAQAAYTYLGVAVIGGLVALMGLFLLQHLLGTTRIGELAALAKACPQKGLLYTAGGCILFGFGAKAGMFPLHIWLPKAHPVAPAPASALLSGVLTKAGVFGILAISCDLFREDPVWGTVLLTLGTVTMVLGAVLALCRTDLKGTLACSSMSQIGFILVGIGMMGLLGEENALAARGTLLHMVNHSTFKLVLFLCAGGIYMQTHTLDLNELRGYGRKKPFLKVVFALGALGIGGIPLFSGYVSKTLLHEAIVEGLPHYGWPLRAVEWLFLLAGGMTLAYMTKLFICIFVEKHPEHQARHDAMDAGLTPACIAALAIPALVIPILGMLPGKTMDAIATLGTDFFHAGHLAHAVHYFTWTNLKGAVISLAIGAALYLLVVRRFMLRNGKYVSPWPKWLDLETLLYRPLLLRWLPAVFGEAARLFGENRLTAPLCKGVLRVAGIAARAVCDLPDALLLCLNRTVFAPTRVHRDDKVTDSWAYRLGFWLDRWAERLGGRSAQERHYAHLLYRSARTLGQTTRRIEGNLSFALLMLTGAICLVFLYMIVWHGPL